MRSSEVSMLSKLSSDLRQHGMICAIASFDRRDEQVIEPDAPETTRNMNNCDVAIVDKKSSNYVKNFEKIDANIDNTMVHSLISLRSSSSRLKKQKRHWLEENIPTGKINKML